MATSTSQKTGKSRQKQVKSNDLVTTHPFVNRASFTGTMVEAVITTINRTKMDPIAFERFSTISRSAVIAFYKKAEINSDASTIHSEVKGIPIAVTPALIAEVLKLNNTGTTLPNVTWRAAKNNPAKLDLWRRYHKVDDKTAKEMEAVYKEAEQTGKKVWEKQFKRACLDPIHYVMAGILAGVWQDKAGSDSSLSFDVMQLVDLMNNDKLRDYNWAQIYFDRLKVCISTAKGPKGNIYRMGRMVTALVQHFMSTENKFTDLLVAEDITYESFKKHLEEDQKAGEKKKSRGKKRKQSKVPEEPKGGKKPKTAKVPSPSSSSSINLSETANSEDVSLSISQSQSQTDQDSEHTAQESEQETAHDSTAQSTPSQTAQPSPPHSPPASETAQLHAIINQQNEEIAALKSQVASLKGKGVTASSDPSEELKKKDEEVKKLLQEIATLKAIARENEELQEININLQGILNLKQQEGPRTKEESENEAVQRLESYLQIVQQQHAKLQKAYQIASTKLTKAGSEGRDILTVMVEGQLKEANEKIEQLEAANLVLQKEIEEKKRGLLLVSEEYKAKAKEAEGRADVERKEGQRYAQQALKYKEELEAATKKLHELTAAHLKLQETAKSPNVAVQENPELQRRVADLTRQLEGMEAIHNDNLTLKAQKEILEKDVKDLESKLTKTEAWGEGWKLQATDLQDKLQKCEGLPDRVATLSASISLAHGDNQRLTNELKARDEQTAKLEKQLATYEQRELEAVQKITNLEEELAEARQALQTAQTSRIHASRTSTAIQTSELDFIDSRVQVLEDDTNKLKGNQTALTEENERLKGEIERLKVETATSTTAQNEEIKRIWAILSKQQENHTKVRKQVTSLVQLQAGIHESTKAFHQATLEGSKAAGLEEPEGTEAALDEPHFGMIKGGEASSSQGKDKQQEHEHIDID